MGSLILLILLVVCAIFVATHSYRHKKGGYYLFLGTVVHTETQEEFALYIGRSGVWVRPYAMFFDGRFVRCCSI